MHLSLGLAIAAIVTLMLGIALMIGGVVRGFLAWSVREAGKPWGWVAVSALIRAPPATRRRSSSRSVATRQSFGRP